MLHQILNTLLFKPDDDVDVDVDDDDDDAMKIVWYKYLHRPYPPIAIV